MIKLHFSVNVICKCQFVNVIIMLEGKDNILGMFILTLVLVKSTATL